MSSNLSFSNSTSKRYALALYELSIENSELEKVEKEIKNLRELFTTSSDFRMIVSNPTIGKKEQGKAILKISEYLKFSEVFKKFLGLLTYNGRLFFLKKIIDSFLQLVSLSKGELSIELISSKKLTEQELILIQKDLSQYLKKKIEIKYIYDNNLIGGFKIQVGSVMIDTSIKSKLKRLEKSMMEL